MPRQPTLTSYKWQGIDRRGQTVSGVIQEMNVSAVKQQLLRQGINSTYIRQQRASLFKQKSRVTPADIALMTRQLAILLEAGVPLLQSLTLIARSSSNTTFSTTIHQLARQVAEGIPLSSALKQFPDKFDALYCDLVLSGEQTGALDQIFSQIADYRERAEALKATVKKALFYPTLVLMVALAVTSILLLFIIPQFADIFDSFGAPLPLFTQGAIALSQWLQRYWFYLLLCFMLLGLGYRRAWRRSARWRYATDRALLSLPIVGSIISKAALTGFARTLATTFSAGIPLVEGLAAAANASGNRIYRQAVLEMRSEVIAGTPISSAMQATPVFPQLMIQMVIVGEESGAIDTIMLKIAHIYEHQVNEMLAGLTSLIEPAIMVILGLIVGSLVIAMYLPIFELGNVIR